MLIPSRRGQSEMTATKTYTAECGWKFAFVEEAVTKGGIPICYSLDPSSTLLVGQLACKSMCSSSSSSSSSAVAICLFVPSYTHSPSSLTNRLLAALYEGQVFRSRTSKRLHNFATVQFVVLLLLSLGTSEQPSRVKLDTG